MKEQAPTGEHRAVVLRTPAGIDQALRDPALRVAGRGTWHDDSRVHDLIDRMPSMHDDEARRACLVPVRALLSPDAARAAAPSMRREMRALALETSQADTHLDLVASYTSLIAPTFLRSHLGLEPALSAHDLRSLSLSLTAELVKQGPPDSDRVDAILDVSDRIRSFASHLRRHPQGDHPLDPLIAAVPDDRDVAAVVCLLASGGLETVSSLTCSVLLAITSDPVHADRWHSDPVAVVDDLAGALPPIMMLARRAEHDTQVDGHMIQAGRTVLLDMNQLSSSPELAFGMGLHRCLGRSVARTIIPIAVDELLQVLPHLRQASFRPSGSSVPGVFRGPMTMPVIFTAGASGLWNAAREVLDERKA